MAGSQPTSQWKNASSKEPDFLRFIESNLIVAKDEAGSHRHNDIFPNTVAMATIRIVLSDEDGLSVVHPFPCVGFYCRSRHYNEDIIKNAVKR